MPDRPIPDWLTTYEFAHRGLHDGITRVENSLSAAEAAIALGMGIELDIQRSRDDQPMVFHDWELSRLTNGDGLVDRHTAQALVQLRLGETSDSPLRLADFLCVIAGRAPLLIEIKSLPDYDVGPSCSAVADALLGYDGEATVMSFDPRVSAWFAEHSPDTIRGLVCTDTLDHGWLSKWREAAVIEKAQPDFLACDIRDLPNDLTRDWRDKGRPLLTWTVRSPELRTRAFEHADALISEGEGLA